MERIEAPPRPTYASPALRALAESVVEIDHYELDSIPLFHLPSSGATMLSLSFGVGTACEPVPHRGVTHLAEHLLLTGIDGALDHSNGTTEPFRVTFTMRGSPQEASAFLRDVCDQIRHPRLSRMHEEAHVLRSEANVRGSTLSPQLRAYQLRMGYQGFGIVHLPEFFLRRLDEKVLGSWIEQHMVAGNAVIWISGPLPDDLLVSLEPGPRTEVPHFHEVDDLKTPTLLNDNVDGVAASFNVERGTPIQMALRVLESRLRKALRVDRGLGYIVSTDYHPVSPDRALASVYASCLPTSVAEVQRAVIEAIDDMANRGPSEAEIGDLYERAVRDLADPMSYPARLDQWTQDWLRGVTPDPASTILDRIWRLTPEEVATAFRAARDSMLLLLPYGAIRPQRRWEDFPGALLGPLGKATAFELSSSAKKAGVYAGVKQPKLFIGKEGLALEADRGPRYLLVPWTDAVAVVREGPNRVLLGADGTFFALFPENWRDGGYATALVDKYAPTAVVIPEGS
jgi:hypothetical protein